MSGKVTELFLELLRSGLWQTIPKTSCLVLSQQEWRNLWLIARKQTVQGLVYYGTNLLPQEQLPPIMTLASWMVEIEKISQDNSKIQDVISEQAVWWDQNNIQAVLMKGQTVADLYPDPSLRISGDIDWYFPNEEDWNRSLIIAKSYNVNPELDSDGDYHYLYRRVVIEHHKSASELSSSQNLKHLKEVESFDSWRDVSQLSPLNNLLLLNTHILKHAMVSGIGLRQFCDISMAYKFYFCDGRNKELAALYFSELSRLGLLKWTFLLHSFLEEHLGLPNKLLPFPTMTTFSLLLIDTES